MTSIEILFDSISIAGINTSQQFVPSFYFPCPSLRLFCDAGTYWGTVLISFGFKIVESGPHLCGFHRMLAIPNKESVDM